jgi:rhamnosyltransferase subunit B
MHSAKIVITTYGSLGDLHPYLPIAQGLQQRGHRVVLATGSLYQAKIEKLGLEFHATRPELPDLECAPEIVARVMDLKTGSRYLAREIIVPALRDSFADLTAATHDADLFITHPVTLAAPLVAQKHGLPWISTVLAPFSIASIYDPPTPPIIPHAAHIYKMGLPGVRALFTIMHWIVDSWIKPYYAYRNELGLPDRGNPFFEGQHSPDRVLALFSSVLASPQPDWPQHAIATGFPFYDTLGEMGWRTSTTKMAAGAHEHSEPREAERDFATTATAIASAPRSPSPLSSELEAFLQAGEPPIVFTLGSSAVMDAGNFYVESSEAVRRLGRRGVLLAGRDENIPAHLPPDVAAFDYAPYSDLFPRAAAIVHQGGVGTTGQALRSGRPQLVMPYSHDQPDHAARVQRLGVGRQIPRVKYTAASAARELQHLLDNPTYAERAAAIGQQVSAENGTLRAIEEIERFLVEHPRKG